jgi:hypothetical protein
MNLIRNRRFAFALRLSSAAAVLIFGGIQAKAAPAADQVAEASCNQYMAPKHDVNGKAIGQEECRMRDLGVIESQRKIHRIDMGLTGTLAGWITKRGARSNHFTSAPEYLFTQTGNHTPRFHGIVRYEAAKGTSLVLLYPETGWNGKLFLMVPGSEGSFRKGNLKPFDKLFDAANPMADTSKYEQALLAKGYAIARPKQNGDRDTPGDYTATLDNGEQWPDQNIQLVPEFHLDEVRLVANILKERLGKKPARTYWYGHSGGAHMGTVLGYMPEINQEADGRNVIDGILIDDSGGGVFAPVLMKNGEDVLFRTAEERAKYVKTIELTHQMYPDYYWPETVWRMDVKQIPDYVSPDDLVNKRERARILREKGLDSKYRMYEVHGISHNGGEMLPNGKQGDVEILDFSKLIDGVADLLDNWVEKGVEPPPTKSDWARLSPTRSALDLPETACPLGVYYPYPTLRGMGGIGQTGFAPFDGASLEPVNGLMEPVDMNGDGERDKRETVTEAWRRLGLLKANESFDRARYVACIQQTASKLQGERFITQRVAEQYIQEAKAKDLPNR